MVRRSRTLLLLGFALLAVGVPQAQTGSRRAVEPASVFFEPTSALSVRETEKVLAIMRDLAETGVSCVFVTHNLYHAFQVCDRFVMMAMDALGRILVIVYTWRGDTIRLISARKATPRERKNY